MDAIAAVIGLGYQLVFHAIGYSGAFVNYAKGGWPDEKYPDVFGKT